MAKVHCVLQGKGGVGKSFISAVMAQYFESKGAKALCIDTDPVNATFFAYEGLGVKRLNIMKDSDIDPRAFDAMVELVGGMKEKVAVIDNGASSFTVLGKYMVTQDVPDVLTSLGHELVIHSVVTGGQALDDTLNGMGAIARNFSCPMVTWLNPFWGPIEREGVPFEEMAEYQEAKDRITAVVRVPNWQAATYGQDLSELLSARKTFDEGLKDKTLTIMQRQRLKKMKEDLFVLLDGVSAVL